MNYNQYIQFVNTILTTLRFMIWARLIASFISTTGNNNPIIELIFKLTEPLLAPFKDLLENFNVSTGMIDFSPLLAFLFIEVVLRPVIYAAVGLIF